MIEEKQINKKNPQTPAKSAEILEQEQHTQVNKDSSKQAPGQKVSQPSLIKNQEKTSKKVFLPNKSFILALITVAATVVIGVFLAQFIKSRVNEKSKSSKQEKSILIPTKVISPPATQPTISQEQNSLKQTSESQFNSLLTEGSEMLDEEMESIPEATESAIDQEI